MACLLVGILQRPIVAQEKPQESSPPPRTIYLTFDDGPLAGSEDVNDAVLREKTKINVFVVGLNTENSKRLKGYLQLYELNLGSRWEIIVLHTLTMITVHTTTTLMPCFRIF
jgi:peptidoglycan/xylan/chitin deacetylase (PgdA/CDA1 family)